MKAVLWKAYGDADVLEVGEVDRPTLGENEILVRIRAATVTAGDIEMRRFAFSGLIAIPLRLLLGIWRPRKGRILGQEFAGDVVEVGSGVDRHDIDDRVTGQAGLKFGGYAEYGVLSAKGPVAKIPEDVSYEEAATIPTAGVYAASFVEAAEVSPGDEILVVGGGGSIGSYVIQLASHAGARVTALDRADKADFMLSLGASEVVDYQSVDFTQHHARYDAILDVIDKSSFPKAAPALKEGGVYLYSDTSIVKLIRSRLSRHRKTRRYRFVTGLTGPGPIEELAGQIASGQLRVPIDSRFTLDEIRQAHRRGESGAKQGHVVVHM